ncbi:bidirectional sugar transporter SWEET12-like isoform X1 [Mangifera indica]|uniref:bidirectional sugar transporter SWEET12-like isoform X1 n=1 Tax=Mangifera indica TaxID=29780 RepID=UPI001CFB6D74|nr:bidirectional sugar transporter SWEET12-like isoform X1 [Mangifera indica]
MAPVISTDNPVAFAFGLLGNAVSFAVFLAPLPTFYRVFKKKSTEGFQSVPYVVGLFSAMSWIYYATLKSNVFLLMTINAFGCFIETVYIAIFLAYAAKQARMLTLRLLILLNFGGFCVILLLSHFLKGQTRLHVLGWVCVSFSVCVFAAPLSIVRLVIRTKSVEFMPFYLSFFLTINAISWFGYGVSLKDIFIAMPNVLGFIFGFLQMVLYAMYRNYKPAVKDVEQAEQSIDIEKQSVSMASQEQSEFIETIHGENTENKGVSADNNQTDNQERNMENSNQDPLSKC